MTQQPFHRLKQHHVKPIRQQGGWAALGAVSVLLGLMAVAQTTLWRQHLQLADQTESAWQHTQALNTAEAALATALHIGPAMHQTTWEPMVGFPETHGVTSTAWCEPPAAPSPAGAKAATDTVWLLVAHACPNADCRFPVKVEVQALSPAQTPEQWAWISSSWQEK